MSSLVPNCFNLSYRMPREILDRFSSSTSEAPQAVE
jgi:hypothetical protein